MTRLPYVRREELGPEGQQLWDAILDGRGDLLVTAEGGLAGPFNAFVTAPGAGRRLSSLGATLRFYTSIERRLSEIAIITVGARWQAEFEWFAHAPMAREHGVSEAVVDVHTSNVVSERPVRVRMQQGTINASRMEVLDSGDTIRFGGGVTMVMTSNSQVMHLDGKLGVP